MFTIIVLILFGLLFLVAELLLLPGVTLGALLSLACYGGASYFSFRDYGFGCGVLVLLLIALLSFIVVVVCLRAKTWQRFSLKHEIRSTSSVQPAETVKIGAEGVTMSRLAPMGKVMIDGVLYEAKSRGEFVDQQRKVEVVGFENFSVIVKTIN